MFRNRSSVGGNGNGNGGSIDTDLERLLLLHMIGALRRQPEGLKKEYLDNYPIIEFKK